MSLVIHQEEAAPILSGLAELRELPEWFRDRQRAAWKQFESLPNPTRKDQTWRFSNVGLLDLAKFKVGGTLTEAERREILERSRGLDQVAGRMIFAGDQLIERDVISDQLKKRGVIFQSLERALVEHTGLFRKHFMSQPAILGSAKFAALHQALVSSGTFLYVPRGVEIELPIEIFHWLHGENACVFPHLLLVTDELAKVTVIESFRSLDQQASGFAWSERLNYRPRRESGLHMRAKLGNQRRGPANEHDNRRSRRVGHEPESASWRKIFALRESQPAQRRRR